MSESRVAVSEVFADVDRWTNAIERAKISKAKEEGKITEIFGTMKKNFQIDDLTAAQKKLEEMNKILRTAEKEMVALRNLIKEKYDL